MATRRLLVERVEKSDDKWKAVSRKKIQVEGDLAEVVAAVPKGICVEIKGLAENATMITALIEERSDLRLSVYNPLDPKQRYKGALGSPFYAQYKLISTIDNRADFYEAAVRHPAWPAASFPSTGDPLAAALLLCRIVDPRWRRSERDPDSSNALYSWLGLDPENVAAAVGERECVRRCTSAQLAVYSWMPSELKEVDDASPEAFLIKVYSHYLAKRRATSAVLRTTQFFVRFVTAFWLSRVTHPELFQSEVFFKRPEEIRAFEARLDAVSGSK